jgi:acetolactate synthase-1/2/3 large subunit
METLGIRRVLTHSEKAAAYMADGYARVSHKPGICMAQSVGAANLASGLQDAYLGLSPVIAITGRMPPIAQYRNAYQEILHSPHSIHNEIKECRYN